MLGNERQSLASATDSSRAAPLSPSHHRPTQHSHLVRPRTAGEILDDAWRLYLADAPILLALTALTAAPAMAGVIWLLTWPASEPTWMATLVPGLLAVWLPLLGLGSGACQELLRRRAADQTVGLASCLGLALRRGLEHLAGAGVVLLVALPGVLLLGSSVLALLTQEFSIVQLTLVLLAWAWLGALRAVTCMVQSILAEGEKSWGAAVLGSARASQRQAARVGPVVLAELALLVLAAINLHLLGRIGLWIGEHLAGFDLAFTGAVLAWSNPVYVLALVLVAMLLLTPFREAAGFLLHADSRARAEGLDLWYRVGHHFPLREGKHLALVLFALGGLLLSAGSLAAADTRLETIQQARAEVRAVRSEVAEADPYPGGQRYSARLRAVANRLEHEGEGRDRGRWLRVTLDGFEHRNRADALNVLDQVERRLALLEESLTPPPDDPKRPTWTREQIKGLLPTENPPEPVRKKGEREPRPKPPPSEKKPPVRSDRDETVRERPSPKDPKVEKPEATSEGLGTGSWLFLGALVAVALVVALFRSRRTEPQAAVPAPTTGPAAPSLDEVFTQPERYQPRGLWDEANELARIGRYREAVHTLYLSVLVLLHRANLLRYERARTNGEYVRQLRGRAELHPPFAELTTRFEVQWYGDHRSQDADYAACRELAQRVWDHVRT